MKYDPADLLNAAEAAQVLGLSHRTAIATYRGRYAGTDHPFPEPVISKGTCVLWARQDLERWARLTGRLA